MRPGGPAASTLQRKPHVSPRPRQRSAPVRTRNPRPGLPQQCVPSACSSRPVGVRIAVSMSFSSRGTDANACSSTSAHPRAHYLEPAPAPHTLHRPTQCPERAEANHQSATIGGTSQGPAPAGWGSPARAESSWPRSCSGYAKGPGSPSADRQWQRPATPRPGLRPWSWCAPS